MSQDPDKCMNAFQHQKASLNMLLTRVVQADALLNISRWFSVKGIPTTPKEEEKPQRDYYKKLQASGEMPEFGGTCAHTHASVSLTSVLLSGHPQTSGYIHVGGFSRRRHLMERSSAESDYRILCCRAGQSYVRENLTN